MRGAGVATATSESTDFDIRQQGKRHGGGDAIGCDAAELGGTWGTLQAGAALRVAHWPGAPNGPGTIVLVQGRAEFIEVYGETIAWLVGRGFAVITFDFRGQGGSRRRTRGTGHVAAFREYVDDLAAVVRHAGEIGLPRPFHIVAHSMGGLVALLGAQTLSREVERMVLLAPLLGIERLPLPAPIIGLVAGAARLGGLSRLAATRMPPPGTQPFEGNRITSDATRYGRLGDLVDRNPALSTGAPTLGWLGAALGAIRRVRRMAGHPLPVPALFVASGADTIVSTAAIDRFARSVSGGGLVIIPHARHQVLIERDELRGAALAAISTFLLDAPRRLTRLPARAGRPLRFTPLLVAQPEASAPSASALASAEVAPEPPAATVPAAGIERIPVFESEAVPADLQATREEFEQDNPATAPLLSRRERRADRIRERLRRREERAAARPSRDEAATPAPMPLRREPRLSDPVSSAAEAAPPGAEPAVDAVAQPAAGMAWPVDTGGTVRSDEPAEPAAPQEPAPVLRDPDERGTTPDDAEKVTSAVPVDQQNSHRTAADEPATPVRPDAATDTRADQDSVARIELLPGRTDGAGALRLDPAAIAARRSDAFAAATRYAPEPRHLAKAARRSPSLGEATRLNVPESPPAAPAPGPGVHNGHALDRGSPDPLREGPAAERPTAEIAVGGTFGALPWAPSPAPLQRVDTDPPGVTGNVPTWPGDSLQPDVLAPWNDADRFAPPGDDGGDGRGDDAAVTPAPSAAGAPEPGEPAPWQSAERFAPPARVDEVDARGGGGPARIVDRRRQTPPVTPRPVRGKGGRKR